MAVFGSLRRALFIAAGTALSALSCSSRDVYLVPAGSAEDASIQPASDAAFMAPVDARRLPDVSPPPFKLGNRDAGDSGPRCETDRYTEVPNPLGVYLVVDQSFSMLDRWSSVETALGDFIAESGTLTDVSMGIQYFAISPNLAEPPIDYQNRACSAATYETPEVAVDPLPGNENALLTSLSAHDPSKRPPLSIIAQSPTDFALKGAITGIRRWSVGKKNPKLAVLLVTDGVQGSQECNTTTLDGSIQAALDGVTGSPSVVTYVLGVRDNLDPWNEVANAGGTAHAYFATTAAPGDILAQLDSIRDVALPCEISVDAQHLAQRDVNVELSSTGTRVVLSRVDAKANCVPAPTSMQWYAAAPDASENIALCPTACASIRATKNATLDVVYGCPTVFAR